jgi:hypothetical protein
VKRQTLDGAADAPFALPEQLAERVMEYEKHWHAQLAATLRGLERLQARRDAAEVTWPCTRLPE